MRWAFLLLLLPLQDAKTRYAEKLTSMNEYFWKERLNLGDWCKANGLIREAKGHYEFMVKKIPGSHPYKSKAENKLTGSWKTRPNTATDAKMKEYSKKLEEYYRAVGDKCFDAYVVARDGGLKKEAAESLEHSVMLFYDNARGRKERGEEKVEGFGWISKADAELIRKTTVNLETEKRSAEDLAKGDDAHAAWETSWVVRSKHYVVRSDMPYRKVVATAEVLEKLYETLLPWLEKSVSEPPVPMAVCFFRRSKDLDVARAKLPGSPDAVSFFHSMTNTVYVRSFDTEREGGGDTDITAIGRSDREFLLHEATHQIIDMGTEQKVYSVYQSANARADAIDNYWCVEGIACYFGTLDWDGGEAKLGREGWRMATAKKLKFSLREFIGLNFDKFVANSFENYSLAYALTHFLVHGKDGAYKKKYLDFLREYYLGNGSVAGFEKIVGKCDDLEKEFRAYLELQ